MEHTIYLDRISIEAILKGTKTQIRIPFREKAKRFYVDNNGIVRESGTLARQRLVAPYFHLDDLFVLEDYYEKEEGIGFFAGSIMRGEKQQSGATFQPDLIPGSKMKKQQSRIRLMVTEIKPQDFTMMTNQEVEAEGFRGNKNKTKNHFDFMDYWCDQYVPGQKDPDMIGWVITFCPMIIA